MNAATGNLVVSALDSSVAAPGMALRVTRRWNQIGNYDGWTGQGMELTDSFDTLWAALLDGSIVVNGVAGTADDLYFHNTGSTFTSPPGIDATLTTAGRVCTLTVAGGYITRITDPSGRYISSYQDANGYLSAFVDGREDTSVKTLYFYSHNVMSGLQDANGNQPYVDMNTASQITVVHLPPATAAPEIMYDYAAPANGSYWATTTVTDPNSHTTAYESTYAGQVVKTTDALGHARSATYTPNGDVASTTDALSNATTYGYDALDNPSSLAIPTGATVRAYYAAGTSCSTSDTAHPYLPKCVDDGEGNQSTAVYDTPGNLTETDNTDTGVTLSYTYNGSSPSCGGVPGQMCTSTDGDGDATSYSYDGDDRVTQVLTDNAATCSYAAGTCVTFSYDANGNRVSRHDATGITTYSYDEQNRQTSKELPSGAMLAETFDAVGNTLTYTDPGGTVAYGYNAANQLTWLAEPGGSCAGTVSLCTVFGNDNDGRRTSTTYPNGVVMTTSYDDSGRPTQVTAVNSGTTLTDYSYTYAHVGADTALVQTAADTAGHTTAYSYDPLDQLTAAVQTDGSTTVAAWRYCYDDAGNRTHTSTATSASATCTDAPTTSYTYNTANQLTALNGTSAGWSYDANGNETAGASLIARTNETYTGSDQLSSITTSGNTLAMAYAGLGNTERVSAGATSYQSGPEGLASQTTAAGTIYFTRDPAGVLISEQTSGGGRHYYLYDGHGSVAGLVDSSGTLTDTYTHDPYGQITARTGTTDNPFMYTAGYTDPTGLQHLGARYYDPHLGRFTQQDPARQGANLYTYAANNPVNLTDPTGASFLSDLEDIGETIVTGIIGCATGIKAAQDTGFLAFLSATAVGETGAVAGSCAVGAGIYISGGELVV